jgi:gliding motility-associated-like protein
VIGPKGRISEWLKKIIFTVSLGLICCTVSAQIVLERSVIGAGEGRISQEGGLEIDMTLGEPVISTSSAGNNVLTQGFHQPEPISKVLLIEVSTAPASCPTSSDGTARIESISGCSAPYSIQWSNGVSEVDSLNRLLPGLYSVTVTSAFCQETVEFEILAGPESRCTIKIFKAFTPNGDGKGDTWVIENIDLPEYAENKVEIFNRWGNTIFSANNYNNVDIVWSGNSEAGNALETGTYFYILETGGLTFKGYVELIR